MKIKSSQTLSSCVATHIYLDIRKISPAVCTLMVNAGNTDPCSYAVALDIELLTTKFSVAKDTKIAMPQIIAKEVAGHAGFWRGVSNIPGKGYPWAQIEYNIDIPPDGSNRSVSLYSFFIPSVRAQWKDAMFNVTTVSLEFTSGAMAYGGLTAAEMEWVWKADMRLELTNTWKFDAIYQSITEGFSDWWEYDGPACTKGTALCNDVFFITPISKDPDIYNSTLYDSANVSYIVHKATNQTGSNPPIDKMWG